MTANRRVLIGQVTRGFLFDFLLAFRASSNSSRIEPSYRDRINNYLGKTLPGRDKSYHNRGSLAHCIVALLRAAVSAQQAGRISTSSISVRFRICGKRIERRAATERKREREKKGRATRYALNKRRAY